MAHDWSGLLVELDSYASRRSKSLLDEADERRRRGGALRIALEATSPKQQSMPTGIAGRGRQFSVSSHDTTIDAILQPATAAPREIIALVDALGARAKPETDEELRRAGGGGGGAGKGSEIERPSAAPPFAPKLASSEHAGRAGVAAGAQPVVIKVTSTVSSKASAAGLMTYLGTRQVEKENGEKGKADIPILDQDGMTIASRDERAAVLEEWVSAFREPYALDAVATLSIKLADTVGDEALHDALNAAFGTKPFVYSHHQDKSVSVYAVTGLPAKTVAGALKARGSAEGPARALEKAEADIAGKMLVAGVSATVQIIGAAVSEKSGRYFLEKFLRTEKHVVTSTGEPVKRSATVKDVADGLWERWSTDIRTVQPRNAFHVIFSARAGTDAEAMKRAVRDFLSEQVAGHRWVTAHHPDTGHVHVHAMISARDDVGKALRLTKPDLYAWRERFAAKARENGIAMVATRRADVAATRPYSQAQAGAYERGRSDPRYLKTTSVEPRVEQKRASVPDRQSLSNGNLAISSKWAATAAAMTRAGANPSVIAAAERFAAAARQQPKGFVLFRIAIEADQRPFDIQAIVSRAARVDLQSVVLKDKNVYVLARSEASASKIERELARQNGDLGPGQETRAASRDFRTRLLTHGLRASVSVEAAGSARDGRPSPWLQDRLRSHASPASPLAAFKTLVSEFHQHKEKTMPLSLEQFDERVARANKSMDRLETMVDSSGERQAVEEMRREISALFAEQRRDIELQQMPSVMSANGGGGTKGAARASDARGPERAAPAAVDPAIAAQQQAIAAGRAARAAREQAGPGKGAPEEQRQQVLRQAEQQRQRDNDRDGAER